jgi:hypothetical protein
VTIAGTEKTNAPFPRAPLAGVVTSSTDVASAAGATKQTPRATANVRVVPTVSDD